MISLNEQFSPCGGQPLLDASRVCPEDTLMPHPQTTDDKPSKRWRLAVFAIIRIQKTFVLVKQRTGGRWTLPGGRVKRHENVEQALRREVFEETGLELLSGSLAGILERTDQRQICLYFKTVPRCWSVRRNGPLQTTCEEIAEVQRWPIDHLPDNLTPQAARVLSQKMAIYETAFWIPEIQVTEDNELEMETNTSHPTDTTL